MDFIFMLTRADKTIEDCLAVFDDIASLGLRHVGFKDVGVPRKTLQSLTTAIRASGAMTYMEVVSETPEAALRSAQMARDLGVDRLLGGTQIDEVCQILDGTDITYYPFPGFPVGHPTKLGGTPADIEAHCRALMKKGCAGADLLAYRATESDPLALVRSARKGLGTEGYLIVAGSVSSKARIRELQAAGADAFTIGTAVFEGSYSPNKGSMRSQLNDVLADCN
jgi:hypothetical protein